MPRGEAMAQTGNWAFPARLQPRPEKLRFDLGAALQSVVLVHSEVPAEAFTASALGTERIGNGTVISSDGLVLTIGYLMTEAESIWLTTNDGTVVPGHALAYDQVTGFGLIQPLGRLNVQPIERGSAAAIGVGDSVIVIGQGGLGHTLDARIIAKREYAGYWEYLLEEALFTAPAHRQWGGTALIGEDGRLLGVGSLLVQETLDGDTLEANMFVPIDLLEPILQEMMRLGRPARAPRPWLGMHTTPMRGHIVVLQLTQQGPADLAGIRVGDIILEVAGEPVSDLAGLFRRVWSAGPAGTEIPLTLARDGATSRVRIASGNREDFLLKPRRH